IRWLCGHLGLSLDEVCVFGDSDNDAEMLALVPNSVVVAGASEKAEKAARWHIGPAGEDSVAQALMEIAEATSEGRLPSFMS
ncbi:MAG: HAD family phosphatase, partial [Olsenella sp.]|nr:HAD family phosphatase [Olsenella sp.]